MRAPGCPRVFAAERVASDLKSPQVIRFAPNGDMFVADSKADQIRVFRIADGSAKPSRAEIFATGLHQPYGIAFYPPGPDPRWIYVANSHSIVRFPYKNGDLQASGRSEVIVDYIPETHHWTRDITFSPDGTTLYLSIGSGSNVALDMFPSRRLRAGLKNGRRRSRSERRGTRSCGVPMFSPLIREERMSESSPLVCGTVQA